MLNGEPMQEETQDMAAASLPVSRPQTDCEAVTAVLGDVLQATRHLRDALRDYNREMYAFKRFLSQGPALSDCLDVLQQWMRLIDGASTAVAEAQANYENTAAAAMGFVSQSRRFLREKQEHLEICMSAEERLCSKMAQQLKIEQLEMTKQPEELQFEVLVEDLKKLFLEEAEPGLNEDFTLQLPFPEAQLSHFRRFMEVQRRHLLDPKLLQAEHMELVQELCTMRSELEVRKLKKSDYQNPDSGASFF